MIYIDPPYNTGSDLVYEDDFTVDTNTYKTVSGDYDEQGNRLVKNNDSNGRFHTDWLNMIYPRLKIAKDLLKEDGVIFISIDDGEVGNLRKLADDVFGEKNFIANLIWQKKFSRANDAMYFSNMHDHILCYARNSKVYSENGWTLGLLPRGEEIPKGYTNPDNDPRGVWTSVTMTAKSGSENLLYEITLPSGRIVTPPSGRYWSCSKETYSKWVADNRIYFGVDGDGVPRKKTFLSEVQDGLRPNTIFFHEEAGHNQEGKQETKELFDGVGVFDNPKPVRLLDMLLKIGNLKDNDIVLDFFSGSATTGHAVMNTNRNESKKIKFILVQIPENCEEETEAFKAGYKTICDIGEDRLRRAGKRLEKLGVDTGFRVLKLDSSNMEDVYYTPQHTEQGMMKGLIDNVKQDRTPLDLLFQIMLEFGISLSSKIECKKIDGKDVYYVADSFLIACFDKSVNDKVVTEIANAKPQYACLRDMDSDATLTNFEQIFKALSPNTECKII